MDKKIKALLNKLKCKLIWKGLNVAYADAQAQVGVTTPNAATSPVTPASVPDTSYVNSLVNNQPVAPQVQPQTVATVQQVQPTQPGQVAQPSQPAVNFDDMIARARQEEKNKLYPELTRLKTELDTKVRRVNELLVSVAEKDAIIEQLKAESKKGESAKVAALEKEVEKLRGELALKDTEISQVKLNSYRDLKINQAGGQLIPELVSGNTIEEIDASIEASKARFKQIAESVRPNTNTTMGNTMMANPSMVNPATTYVPPVASPSVSNSGNPVSLDDFDLFTAEGRRNYENFRKSMNIK